MNYNDGRMTIREKIVSLMIDGDARGIREVADTINENYKSVSVELSKMCAEGLLARPSLGIYQKNLRVYDEGFTSNARGLKQPASTPATAYEQFSVVTVKYLIATGYKAEDYVRDFILKIASKHCIDAYISDVQPASEKTVDFEIKLKR